MARALVCLLAALVLAVAVSQSVENLDTTERMRHRRKRRGWMSDFGRGFFQVPRGSFTNVFNFAGNGKQFIGFRQFNERPRPFRRNDIRTRFPHKCRGARTPSYDGFCNNRRRPALGSAGTPFKLLSRTSPTHEMSGATRPNPRVISNLISKDDDKTGNHRRLSEMVTFFGQFIDHTVTETENEKESAPIAVPANDTTFAGGVIPFFRTRKEKTPRGWAAINLLPSFIDAANVYGPSEERARSLRSLKGGKLRAGPGNVLPRDENQRYVAGDRRTNENPALTALHTLFFREHNRVCDEIAAAFPWRAGSDEWLYQAARRVVTAELQAIVYHEFLPAVLGNRRMPAYYGYRARVDPRVSNEFSTVAYRVGHTLINKFITAVSPAGKTTRLPLREAFFSPTAFAQLTFDGLIRGAVSTQAAEVDVKVTGEVRNFLLGNPTNNLRLDLAALNIQRGRDHAVPSYNDMRAAYGLWKVRSFKEITSNAELAARLERLYKGVDDVDAWVGGLAEDHVRGASLGPLFVRAWVAEFRRLRDGDRFYYENWGHFPRAWRRAVPTVRRLFRYRKGGVLRKIILDNTDIPKRFVKRNPFKVARKRTAWVPWAAPYF